MPVPNQNIYPQKGFQTSFLASPADIVIGGGAAGAGKSYALLLEAARYSGNPHFGAVIFRKTFKQIELTGGLWDTAATVYPSLKATPVQSQLQWRFPSGATVTFQHLQHEKNILDHQGAQYPFIGFDELTHFSESQFFYLLSRNRSMCGVPPYVRATCNPDPDSWVARLIEWWIDPETGFPIPERAGKLRYFTRDGGNMVWGDTKQDVIDKCGHLFQSDALIGADLNDLIKSITFVPGTINDNILLLKADPGYLANLLSQSEADKAALLDGNWKVRLDDLCLFQYGAIQSLFSNHIEPGKDKYITVDVARFGRDFTVIASWQGFRVVRLEVMTKSDIMAVHGAIESERKRMQVMASNVIVDEDGVGGGVKDIGKYKGFTSNSSPVQIGKEKENFQNLKTQCYYRFADRVNRGEVCLPDDVLIVVDGVVSQTVKMGGKTVRVLDLVKEDFRSCKRDKVDTDGKLRMIPKEQQKNMLSGRSPDFSDSLSMREIFELKPKGGISW